ncbi:3' terminal RNA ribose 2'-O-methyltransferase Hen1 [Rhodococcus sp. IEGM 1330]|uniref:3' terminal RNA ribose 2'-O-methyltransferase Hen1 n=1 Tax=Rhodococcus sp. IEGM 1330 TaxID=3082225 RepID=UPI0029545CDC|nr:3' terminal RNA ribose 2'-O-methyltransferase Hen1 [Rhodococcus sp. IEGM 1330]MDV8021942.1 3' terminal RNA ribose 2'-O-methyltransferase Hen1 [Rhodococcus sp. IEGM 1330]
MTANATTDFPDASDIGYLLHKHPDRVQSWNLPMGTTTVLYPEVSAQRTTVAVLLNDGAASGLAVALSRLFKQTLAGVCTGSPELVSAAIDLTIALPAAPSRGAADLASRMFGPLGWNVDATAIALDPTRPDWGNSEYIDLVLTGTFTLSAALRHLYVLLPVLDDGKHYWVGEDEADKLVRAAGDWLGDHPESSLIASRYLAHRRELVASALDRLVPDAPEEGATPRDPTLAEQRVRAVLAALTGVGAKSVIDLGCGEGRLLRELFADNDFERIVGADVSDRALAKAQRRLRVDDMPDRQRARIELVQSSATYRDVRLQGFDAMVLMEVIEHVDLDRLPALVRSVFREARPRTVLVTTPNSEYNVLYPGLEPGTFRHVDHRFEFTRAQFEQWASSVADGHAYSVRFDRIGPVDDMHGTPTQIAVFTREEQSP